MSSIRKIALVEDDEPSRTITLRPLQGRGHTVPCVVDRQHAVELAHPERPDNIPMDIKAPVLDCINPHEYLGRFAHTVMEF